VIRALLFLALAACHAPAPPSPPAPIPRAPASLAVRGVALGLWDFASRTSYAAELGELAALGASHVMLPVSWRQEDVTSSTLAPHPAATVPDALYARVIGEARAAGLGVLVFPIVDLAVIRPGQWRGALVPSDAEAWWRSYRAFVLHYARLAAAHGAEAFSLGSELGWSEGDRDRWYALASAVRAVYPGTLVYSANWDHYAHVSFWERVDAVGVSSYAPLAASADAPVAEMEAAWRARRAELVDFATRAGKPLWLTELGCPSRDGAATAPWDYTRDAPVDLEEQRRVYAAFARAFADEPRLTGVFVWNWWGEGGPDDGDYTPRGKPAGEVLRAFFGRR
jgi:hypothetical protein